MNRGEARIIAWGENGARVCAAAARISTTEGGALDALSRGDGAEKDAKLILKVLSSGHKTVVEHQVFTIAFHDVSVLAEQLLIEHRLASYTVKSRRYVNFSGAGYVTPGEVPESRMHEFRAQMDAKFVCYARLLELGIPREDARFVLPYCFKSNFFLTANARELAHILFSMTKGRMSPYAEMRELGATLLAQAEALFPGFSRILAGERENFAREQASFIQKPAREAAQAVAVVCKTQDEKAALDAALDFSGRFSQNGAYGALARDARPRELEVLNYTFKIEGVSLACVTHFARHRIQSLLTSGVEGALLGGGYVLPATVRAQPEALAVYREAFENSARAAENWLASGLPPEALAYFALAGHTARILVTMNARELLHFFKLRTCARAQWEIRAAAGEMLALLMEDFPELFRYYGPSCAVEGFCPEGRLSCGRIQKLEV